MEQAYCWHKHLISSPPDLEVAFFCVCSIVILYCCTVYCSNGITVVVDWSSEVFLISSIVISALVIRRVVFFRVL